LEGAFEDHFVELWGTGFRVAYRLSGNRADAEDMTADTLADALRGWGRIREPTGWVARVVARRTLRLVKSHRWLRPEAELPEVADSTELLRWELAQVMQQLLQA
jgi:DNA-directed RNA polymerase specialized sigma24 family protein